MIFKDIYYVNVGYYVILRPHLTYIILTKVINEFGDIKKYRFCYRHNGPDHIVLYKDVDLYLSWAAKISRKHQNRMARYINDLNDYSLKHSEHLQIYSKKLWKKYKKRSAV